jgi:hypothetical protein
MIWLLKWAIWGELVEGAGEKEKVMEGECNQSR